ncbi:MAG: hypothetical protein U0270_04000 [Labilithrix sp.]
MRFLVLTLLPVASLALTGCFVDIFTDDDPAPAPPPAAKPATTTTTAPPSSPPASSAPAGTCAPSAACGGLRSCTDDCYGQQCCNITCHCGEGDDQDHLYCQMECRKH